MALTCNMVVEKGGMKDYACSGVHNSGDGFWPLIFDNDEDDEDEDEDEDSDNDDVQ